MQISLIDSMVKLSGTPTGEEGADPLTGEAPEAGLFASLLGEQLASTETGETASMTGLLVTEAASEEGLGAEEVEAADSEDGAVPPVLALDEGEALETAEEDTADFNPNMAVPLTQEPPRTPVPVTGQGASGRTAGNVALESPGTGSESAGRAGGIAVANPVLTGAQLPAVSADGEVTNPPATAATAATTAAAAAQTEFSAEGAEAAPGRPADATALAAQRAAEPSTRTGKGEAEVPLLANSQAAKPELLAEKPAVPATPRPGEVSAPTLRADLAQTGGERTSTRQEGSSPPSTEVQNVVFSEGLAKAAGDPALAGSRDASASVPVHRTTLEMAGEMVVKNVRYLVSKQGEVMTVRLVPKSLGELHLQVRSIDGTMEVRLSSANPAVREALEGQLAGLKEALVRQGLNVDRVVVSSGLAADTSSGGPQSRQAQPGSPGTGAQPSRPGFANEDAGKWQGPRNGSLVHDGVLDMLV